MLKILRKGEKTLPEDKTYKMKCKTCGCEYTYQGKDIKQNNTSIHESIPYVVCPQCDYINHILFKRKYKCELGDKNE